MKYTDEYIISKLKSVDEDIEGPVTVEDVKDHCPFSMGAVRSHFGGLNSAKDVAGIEKSRQGGYKRYTDEEVVEWVIEKDEELDGLLKYSHIREEAPFSVNVVYTKFGSLNELKDILEIEKNPTSRPDITGEEYYNKVKSSIECQNCNEDFCETIDFHHTEESKKLFSIGRNDIKNADRKYEEMKKCVAICANCHRKHHSDMHNFDAGKLSTCDIPLPSEVSN